MDSGTKSNRHIGLFGATGVGVGAMVGGGILAMIVGVFWMKKITNLEY